MGKETPFDRARDFVEEKIDQTKEVLGESYSKARDQFDDVSEDVRKNVKTTAQKLQKDYGYALGRRARLRAGEPGRGAGASRSAPASSSASCCAAATTSLPPVRGDAAPAPSLL